MISLSSTAAMLRAMGTAREIAFSSYFLPGGRVERALEDAAKRGAHVTLRLNGYFYGGRGGMLDANERLVRRLKREGAHVDAAIVHRRDDDGAGMHAKAAVCDGAAFLDDCNWRADDRDTVVRVNGPAAGAVRAAITGKSAHCARIAFDKTDALNAEAGLLRRSAGMPVDVQAESIRYSRVYSALKELAANGTPCRLLLSPDGIAGNYKRAAELLAQAGVQVRVGKSTEKFALADAKRAWIGSANPTSDHCDGNQIEWALRTRSTRIVASLHARFEQNWKRAKPLSGQCMKPE